MSAYAFNGMSIRTTRRATSPTSANGPAELAELIAKGENIEMTPEHWEVVNFLRAYADPKHFCRSAMTTSWSRSTASSATPRSPSRRKPPRFRRPPTTVISRCSTTISAGAHDVRLISRDDEPELSRRSFLARCGRVRGDRARARRHPLRVRRVAAPVARRACVGKSALGDADRHQQVRRRLRQVRHRVPRRNGWGGSGNRETDAQWIRKVSLRDPKTGWRAKRR